MRDVVLLALASMLLGCAERSVSSMDPKQDRVETRDLPVRVYRDVDLLFVIDDSPSMADKQQNLAANFPKLIDALSRLPGGLPNLHVGVVTSDMGTSAASDETPGPPVGTIGRGG